MKYVKFFDESGEETKTVDFGEVQDGSESTRSIFIQNMGKGFLVKPTMELSEEI